MLGPTSRRQKSIKRSHTSFLEISGSCKRNLLPYRGGPPIKPGTQPAITSRFWSTTFEAMLDRPAKLVIVCGLPGSGKTTHAKLLEKSLFAVRFCPDEWLQSLSLSLWDGERRARIEAIQWELAQKLLECGTSVIN
jgi:hypothetical protein